MSFFRRLSKSDRDRDRDNRTSHHSDRGPISPTSPPTSYNMPIGGLPPHGDSHHSRPASSTAMSDTSYDFATHQNPSHPQSHHNTNNPQTLISPTNQQNTSHRFANNPPPAPQSATSTSRPMSHTLPAIPNINTSSTNASSGNTGSGSLGNLSRTDQVVLRYFWESKFEENSNRDLHFLKFPAFGLQPSDRELVPFCEIYALVKGSKGAEIVGLGTLGGGAGGGGGGTFIGFELFSAAQLHIDLSDTWTVPISHHRVSFKPFDTLLREAGSTPSSSHPHSAQGGLVEQVRSWPKPLTIEFLEEMYSERWARDLNALCWESREVRELGGGMQQGQDGGHGGGIDGSGGGGGGGRGEVDDGGEEFVH